MAEIDIPRSRALLAWDALDAAADSRGRRLEWLFTHNVNTKTPPGEAEKKKEKQFSAHFHSAELEGWPPIQCCHRRPLPLLAYPPHEREANESQHLSSSRIPPSSFLSGLLWLFPAKHLPYRVGVAFSGWRCDEDDDNRPSVSSTQRIRRIPDPYF